MKIYSVRRLDETNVGDLYCDPLRYFSFGDRDVVEIDIDDKDCFREIPLGATVVVGGGGLLDARRKWNRNLRRLFSRNRVIIWGAGSNTHYDRKIGRPLDLTKATFVGVRDYNSPFKHVPCASCMLPDLDREIGLQREVCVYEHKNVPIDHPALAGVDRMDNGTDDIAGVLRFLNSSAAVVTNTYHGAYWSLLLGKRVVLYEKFSSRFDGFPVNLAAFTGNLEADLDQTQPCESYLEYCRGANQWFAAYASRFLDQEP